MRGKERSRPEFSIAQTGVSGSVPAVNALRMGFLTVMATLAVTVGRAQTAVLIDEYALRGTLNDNLGGPSLTTVLFSGVAGAITPNGYVFGSNQGLMLISPTLDPSNYSIELSFSISATSGYRKLIDFKNLTADAGFYNLNTALNFYPVITGVAGDFASNVDVHVVLTRDSESGTVTGYVNGLQRFSFNDASSLAVFSTSDHRAIFMVDDFATGQNEVSGGTLNYLRIYNGVLTPARSPRPISPVRLLCPSRKPSPCLPSAARWSWRRRGAGG